MALDATAVANLIETTITHLQLHNGAPGAAYTTNVVGSRVAATGKVAGNNLITLTGTWAGLTANQAVTHVSYWTAVTAGTNYGGAALSGTGDLSANAAGDFVVNVTETGTAT